ncbi:MAG: hypothetical protein ACXVFV_01475, partial [Mycobacteriales bacterium]
DARDEAKAILAAHRGELDVLAGRLDAEETLEGEVLQEALAPLVHAIATPPAGTRRVRAAASPAGRRTPAAKGRTAARS